MRSMMMRKSQSLLSERKCKICKKYGFDWSQVRMSSLIKLRTISVKAKNVSKLLKDGQDIRILLSTKGS